MLNPYSNHTFRCNLNLKHHLGEEILYLINQPKIQDRQLHIYY